MVHVKYLILHSALRFRLATVCKDSTGCLAVLFPHEEIQRIIGKDVFDIENDDTQVSITKTLYTFNYIPSQMS